MCVSVYIFVGYRIHHSSNGDHHEVTAPLMPGPAATAHNHAIQDTNNDDSADHDEGRITQETADTVNNEQGDTRQETSANGHSQLVPSGENVASNYIHYKLMHRLYQTQSNLSVYKPRPSLVCVGFKASKADKRMNLGIL